MIKYLPQIFFGTLILITWIFSGFFLYPKIKDRISKKDWILLGLLCLAVVGALVYTYVQTNGTFVWR
jgi:Na+/melibiose symporter-like transporter